MEEKCSIYTILNLNCNNCENRKNFKINVEGLSDKEKSVCQLLYTPSNYYIEGLDKETKKCVVQFCEMMLVMMCVQVKQIVSIRNKDFSKGNI